MRLCFFIRKISGCKMLYRISKKSAGIGIILMNIFAIAVFWLVMLKILPYNSIGGGRLESYQAAVQSSIISIIIMCFGMPLVALVSGLMKAERFKTFFRCWLGFAFLLIAFFLCQAAIAGIIIICFGIPLIAAASRFIKYERFNFFRKVYLWFNFVFVCFNTFANLFGVTLFEKIVMALVTVIQAILFLRLATDKN